MPDTPPSPHLALERDAKGRIAQRTLALGGTPEIRRYAYDSAGRLSRVTDESGALVEAYTYDHQGRRLADIRPIFHRRGQRGERRFSYGPGDRLAAAGSAQYGHDRAGFRNLKVMGNAETWYHYEPSGLLLAVDLPGGSRIEYAYDAGGLRREKRRDGRLVAAYTWLDPLRLAEFFDGARWWRFAYTEGRTPVGVTNGRDSFLILSGHLGTPVALATIDGHVVQKMRYDSFGNLLESWGGVVDLPLGFAGGLFDPDTGLTRFVWRDYDAETGRFTALDPLREKGGDTDYYGYCVDDPVNRVDVWGLFTFEERPLDGPFGSLPKITSPVLDKLNLELKHVQGWFDDGSGDSVGRFPSGRLPDKKHSRDEYMPTSESYPDEIAREALRRWPQDTEGPYSTIRNNCQDWEDEMRRKMYEVGRDMRGSSMDPR